MAERKTRRKSRRPYRSTFRATTTGRALASCEGKKISKKFCEKSLVIGIQKRYDPKKTYLFVTMVKWSDGSELIIYRTMPQVQDLITNIKKRVPREIRSDCEEPIKAMEQCVLKVGSLGVAYASIFSENYTELSLESPAFIEQIV